MINLSPLLNNKNEKKPLSEVFELKNSKPSIINTAGKVVTGIGGFVKDILLEAPARAAAALTLEATKQESLTPTSPIEKFFLGDEKVKKVSTMVEEAGKTGKELFIGEEARTFGEVAGKGLAIGLVALDLTPFGGARKNLVKELTSLKNVEKIEVVLKNAGVSDDLISIYAPKFAKLKKSKEVSEGLKSLENIIKETKTTTQTIKGVDTKLAKEAIKYKSAEEFVKAQGTPVYHGTQAKFNKFDSKFATDAEGRKLNLGWGKGNFYFTTKKGEALKYATRERSPEIAKLYPKGEPNVIEAFIDIKKPFDIEIGKNAERWRKVRDGYWTDGVSDFNYHKIQKGKTKAEAFVEQLKKEGYDGIIDGQEVTAFSENSIKTKSQLTDIWNKANK